LEDIRDAGRFVLDDSAGETFESYLENRRLRQSVERSFEIIGEAMRRLSDEDPEVAARIPARRRIIAFRNVLIHGYDLLDYEEIWRILRDSLPILIAEVESLLRESAE
jgi:uncharacterized protein with HEPN domain